MSGCWGGLLAPGERRERSAVLGPVLDDTDDEEDHGREVRAPHRAGDSTGQKRSLTGLEHSRSYRIPATGRSIDRLAEHCCIAGPQVMGRFVRRGEIEPSAFDREQLGP